MKDFKTDFKQYLHSININHFNFEYYRFPMKWGVMVDFFDSVGLHIDILVSDKFNIPDQKEDVLYFYNCQQQWSINSCKTRQEAREKALEKAIEIYNK